LWYHNPYPAIERHADFCADAQLSVVRNGCRSSRIFAEDRTAAPAWSSPAADAALADRGCQLLHHLTRGLDRTLFLKLAGCDWIREHRHCLLTGPCGVGKSWLACALGFKACRENHSVLYQRVPRLFALLALGRGDGRYPKLMRQLGRVDLLILDDWGPEPLLPEQQRDLLEIVEDRYNVGSLIITSQLPVDRWYELVGNPTLADAILDRIVHNAYRVELSGESLRKPRASA
jgi:DNA replication protein DnaC